jgi:F0F1-type ATP synthase assembly protein I
MLSNQANPETGGWVRSAGFLFVAVTTVPILIGIRIGSFFRQEPWGALVGVVVGLALAIWGVIRPLWIEADRTDDQKRL